MSTMPSIDGLAALAICESLLLALNDRNVMPEGAILDVLTGAAETLESPPTATAQAPTDTNTNTDAAKLIRNIIAGRNSVRRP